MKRAVWDPGWYGGDQSIAVRLTDDFFFWKPSRSLLSKWRRLTFYDDFSRRGDVVVGRGTIARIWHTQLGEIREIDTLGDNYKVYLANGTIFNVDQEQAPGRVADAWAFDTDGKPHPRRAPGVQSWRVDVEFASLSKLRPPDSESGQRSGRRGERRMTLEELSQRHGVALADLVDASVSLGRSEATTEPLSAEDVWVIEAQLGLDGP